MDAAYFLARLTGTNSASKLTAHASSAHLDSILAQATSFGSSLDGSSSDNSDTEGGNLSDGSRDNRSQLQQESSGIDADVKSQYKQLETQSKYRRHLSAVKSAADTAAEEAEESGTQQKPGYTGSAAVVGRANLSRYTAGICAYGFVGYAAGVRFCVCKFAEAVVNILVFVHVCAQVNSSKCA